MTNDILKEIYIPIEKEKDLWPLLQSDSGCYELRVGGFNLIHPQGLNPNQYDKLKIPFNGKRIGKQYTDEENLFIVVDDKFIIESGLLVFEPNRGNTFGVTFYEIDESNINIFSDGSLIEL